MNRTQLRLELASREVPSFPTGSYSIILADPPWKYNLRDDDESHRGRTPYPTMSIEQIANLPVYLIADDDSYLFLWTTKDHLEFSYDIISSWGFTFKNVFTWVKMSSKNTPYISTGHWGRNCCEFLMLATRGKAKSFTTLKLTDIPTVIFAPRRSHSEKPEESYQIIDRLHQALGNPPRIELFARSARKNWTVWGNEVT